MYSAVYHLKVSPVDLLNVLHEQKGFFLLESSMPHRERGRYSFLGYDPVAIVEGNNRAAFEKLRERFKRYKIAKCSLTPFPAGIAGFLSYDFGLQFEQIGSRHPRLLGVPGFFFGFYDRVITIDHLQKRLIVTALYKKRIEEFTRILSRIHPFSPIVKMIGAAPRLKSNFTKSGYCNAVQKALDYIKKGDLYQVNVAQEFSWCSRRLVNAGRLYCALRKFSPSCFGGFWNAGDFQIASSSPEMFLTLRDGIVRTRPMKGTRPRGQNIRQDRRNNAELRYNRKEQAELLMVTDLERNDLGRVCDFGSVQVEQIREIETYRTVYQATATVAGRLKKDKNAFDVIETCFPSGSITGCPKIRSMMLIDELEHSSRGVYTGALGYISFSGEMAFNVLIRTILVLGQRVSFHAGSGIVADSDPHREYEETLVKAQAMRESLRML